jgi:hypothetical protein
MKTIKQKNMTLEIHYVRKPSLMKKEITNGNLKNHGKHLHKM